MSKPVVIFDLDNCLSDDRHRISRIRWDNKDPAHRYSDYHAACHLDSPANVDVFLEHIERGHEPLFITGRPEAVRDETEAWISLHLNRNAGRHNLLMRPQGCELASVDLKVMLLEKWFVEQGKSRVIANAYDDHPAIVEAYRAAFGIPATVMLIHLEDAYRDSDSLKRKHPNQQTDPVIHELRIDGGHQAWLDAVADMGPVQGARPERIPASTILRAMADTFDERNAVYRDNSRMIPNLMRALFPGGVPPQLVVEEEWHLFELILVKLARFASANLTHVDSIHDIAPYCAMIETILKEKQQ